MRVHKASQASRVYTEAVRGTKPGLLSDSLEFLRKVAVSPVGWLRIRAATRVKFAYTSGVTCHTKHKKAKLISSLESALRVGSAIKVKESKHAPTPVIRETVESFAVALILAFLFRAFVAEAFVIPTGSMAPTLMGAHKDVTCPECGYGYQSGASSEFDTLGRLKDEVVVGTTCPLCRYQLPLDLQGNANHATFSGDRILVSKFAYLWREPSRWDVIVFKYPKEARQNYIKRLVGRPNEKLKVRHGDIHVQPLDNSKPIEIARKPANVIGAVLQPVHDTDHLPTSLLKAGLPSSFQPFPNSGESPSTQWKIQQDGNEWNAQLQSADPERIAWIRYFHKVVDPRIWEEVKTSGAFPTPLDPYASRLITDFTHYNGSISTSAGNVYVYKENGKIRTNTFKNSYKSGVDIQGHDGVNFEQRTNIENDGLHWVGDLAAEFDLEVQSNTGNVILDLVEFGIHHQCQIDVGTGKAIFRLLKGEEALNGIEDGEGGHVNEAIAQTSIRGSGSYRIRFANIDDQVTLWVGGRSIPFSPTNRFSLDNIIADSERYPHWTMQDPLDGAPVGFGSTGTKVKITRAKVWRDVYYIAVRSGYTYNDYEEVGKVLEQSVSESERLQYLAAVSPKRRADRVSLPSGPWNALLRDTLYSTPDLWKDAATFSSRRSVDFTLEQDQYFPMGDNSPESFDARGWDVNFVPERLLIGRAIMVFWPHYWNRPVPFTPNIGRMRLIR